jgi:F-type H+-transporting ATPase subunit delta
MPEEEIAQRYAEALYELAEAEGLEERIGEDLARLSELWLPELELFLAHPRIPAEVGEDLLLRTLAGQVHPYTLNLLRLMVRKGRAGLVPLVRENFLRSAEARGKLTHVRLRSARPLSQAEVAKLRAHLEKALGTRVILWTEEDPELLAGVELLVRGRRLDASLWGRLGRLAAGLRG